MFKGFLVFRSFRVLRVFRVVIVFVFLGFLENLVSKVWEFRKLRV